MLRYKTQVVKLAREIGEIYQKHGLYGLNGIPAHRDCMTTSVLRLAAEEGKAQTTVSDQYYPLATPLKSQKIEATRC